MESAGRRFIQAIVAHGSQAAHDLLAGEERRWQLLWLRSLEYLLVLENSPHLVCPRHLTTAKPPSPPDSGEASSSKRQRLDTLTQLELAAMRNRRVQTNMVAAATDLTLDLPRPYYANKAAGGVGGGFEVVHKDIGYSSDADMSDFGPENNKNAANQQLSNSSDHVNHGHSSGHSSRSSRKRSVRRRRATAHRPPVRRPWSFHDGWTDWDYYQPPSYTPLYANKSESIVSDNCEYFYF